MITKKSTAEPAAPKSSTKKNKTEATFEFSRFQDEIQTQAYYNYLKRVKNNIPGDQVGDWLEAENILRLNKSTY